MALVDNAWYVNYGNGSSTGYYGVTAWAALTTKTCGNLIRQLAAPAVGSERVFVCTKSTAGTGVTSAAEVTWTITRGAITADTGTLNWQECTGIAALNGDFSANTPKWSNASIKNSAITLGQVITDVAGTIVLICTVAGTAGNGSEPSWNAYTTAGATTTDNGVTWTNIGVVGNFTGWQAPHARLQNSFTANWGKAGNTFFVGDNHAETQSTAVNLASPGTTSNICYIYCVDHTVAVPPGTNDLKTTATITCSGANFTISSTSDYNYWYGITFQTGASAGYIAFGVSVNSKDTLENCKIIQNNVGGTIYIAYSGGVLVKLINTTLKFASTACSVSLNNGSLEWINTASAIDAGGSAPTLLFSSANSAGATVILRGVDLSALGSGKTIIGGGINISRMVLIDCNLGASVTVAAASATLAGARTDLVRCDSGATNYRHERYWYEGTQIVETTIVRTGGASDGTTPISWKIVNTANSRWVEPFESLPITIWNTSTSAITTLTIYGTTTGGGVPNNDDIWVEVEYLGSGSSPMGSFITTTKANNLAASTTTNNSSDASTWGGSGAGNGFKIVVPSFTPGMAGPINITIKAAKASATYYIDPRPAISGVTVSKSEILAPGVYANELSSGGGGGLAQSPMVIQRGTPF